MADSRNHKLIDLGANALADALLNLAVHSDEADDLIEQLIATPSAYCNSEAWLHQGVSPWSPLFKESGQTRNNRFRLERV